MNRHEPLVDDGVTYCGWHVGNGVVIDGCGHIWPCSRQPYPCPGCGKVSDVDGDDCEYLNMMSGRTHYCGRDECYCRGTRGFMRGEFLNHIESAWNRRNQ